MGQSKTSKYYANNPKARKKRNADQRERNKRPGASKYRQSCNEARVRLGLKKGDGMDASHTKDGGVVAEKRRPNRQRNRGKK